MHVRFLGAENTLAVLEKEEEVPSGAKFLNENSSLVLEPGLYELIPHLTRYILQPRHRRFLTR